MGCDQSGERGTRSTGRTVDLTVEPVLCLRYMNLYLPPARFELFFQVWEISYSLVCHNHQIQVLMGPCRNHILNSFCNCPRITAPSEKERKTQQMIRRGARLGGHLSLDVSYSPGVIPVQPPALLPPSYPLKGWG